ncbi:MAG: hypothetical protein EA426_15855, partial [Spirochaetaceae bacterium]
LIVVAGCDFFGVSIRDRIDQFMGDVNAGRFSDLKEHLNSGADNYGNADAAFWATYFDEAETYTLNDLTITGSTATGVMESSDPSWDTLSVTFSMREETPGVWKILSITRGNDTIFD